MCNFISKFCTCGLQIIPLSVFSRSSAGFVGLKNGGATCYMNSVLQQLFMTPGVVEAVLGVEDNADNDDDTVLFQLQTVLGHLLESKLQYYKPENFWKVRHRFIIWNKLQIVCKFGIWNAAVSYRQYLAIC